MIKKHYTNVRFHICLFLTVYLIYNVNYNFTFGIPSSYLILFFMLIYCIINILNKKTLPIKNKSALLFSFLLFSWSIFSFINNPENSSDSYFIRTSFLYFLIILFSASIYKFIFLENNLLLLKTIGFAGLVNSIFIILMLISTSFQSSYLSLINQKTFSLIGGNDALNGAMSLRMIGISGISVYSIGFVQVLCSISYLLFIYYKNNRRIKLTLNDSIILILLVVSSVISARSSLIGIMFFLLIFLKISQFKQTLKFLVSSSLLITIIFSIVISLLPLTFKEFFLSWITEIFVSGTKTGSLQENINMFIYGWNDFSFLGDSRWYGNNNDYYMNTDVGWYRILFSVGYIGLLLWIFTITFIFLNKNMFFRKFNNESWVSILLLIYTIVITFKGAILFDSFQSLFIFMMINLIFQKENKINRKYISNHSCLQRSSI